MHKDDLTDNLVNRVPFLASIYVMCLPYFSHYCQIIFSFYLVSGIFFLCMSCSGCVSQALFILTIGLASLF